MRVAVIGSGVSGLGAALALADVADVRLFEREPRFGGHVNTVEVDYDGAPIAVDTGFIVYNEENYPNLTALFAHLGVATEPSDMTFSISIDQGAVEYACDSVDKVFAQRWRLADPRYWMTMREIMRFNATAKRALAGRDAAKGVAEIDGVTLKTWLDANGFSERFREFFLRPMAGAIWSTAADRVEAFPARAFIQFFANHALMNGFVRKITWRTVSGGARRYVDTVMTRLGPRAQAGVAARAVRRRSDGLVDVAFSDGSEGVFDHVVLATHSDQSAALLTDAAPLERQLLGEIGYAPNRAVLHRDAALMPKRRKVWSAWNFLGETGREARPPAVTYWMNKLQNIDNATPLFVSLNPPKPVDPALVFGEFSYAHPQYGAGSFAAQAQLDAVQGRGGVWHAGAWLGWGFHEDGLRSGLRVAAALGATPTWAREIGAPLIPAPAMAAE